MRSSSELRYIARSSLKGKWLIAVIVGLIASLLGAATFDGPEITLNFSSSGANVNLDYAGQTLFSVGHEVSSGFLAFLIGSAVYFVIAAVILGILYFVLGSIIEIGYARFNLELVDQQNPSFESLFAYFSYWKTAALARLLQTIYILLWSLLLIIPGIIASYSYAMTKYILAEHPELTPSEAITRSKEMMTGNRWSLFILQLSFIGWRILCLFTLGIGNLWLNPYVNAAEAAFYRDLSGTYRAPTPEFFEPI